MAEEVKLFGKEPNKSINPDEVVVLVLRCKVESHGDVKDILPSTLFHFRLVSKPNHA